MKTVLVMSTALDKSIEHTKWQQPLGLAYIAACVRDIADVSIIDCEVDEQYTKTLLKEIDTDDQLVVGFSANTYSYPEALKLAQLVKEHNPEAHINFGGYHVTPLADLVLRNRPFIDSVIRGDGEVPFRQLLLALSNGNDLSKVGSLTYRNNGKIISNLDAPLPDLDSLPYPARDLLPMETYFDNLKGSTFSKIYNASRMVYVNATRGCPNNCNYCCLFNKKWRGRKPESIADEFKFVKEEYDAEVIYLVGDNLNFSQKFLKNVCEEIIDEKIDLKWIGVTANPRNISKKLVTLMKKSGCISIVFGLESASDRILASMNRKYLFSDYEKNMNLFRGSNVAVCVSFILGYPGESEDTLKSTLDFVKKFGFERVFASILVPLPGSKIYDWCCDVIPNLSEMDVVSVEMVKKIFLENYSDLNYNRLEEFRIHLTEASSVRYNMY